MKKQYGEIELANLKQGNWLKISDPEDLQRALAKMLNKILMCEDPLLHAGQFASLSNAWTNAHRLFLEDKEITAIKQEIESLKQMASFVNEQKKAITELEKKKLVEVEGDEE